MIGMILYTNQNNYSFISNEGAFNNRFEIVYKNSLSNNDVVIENNEIIVFNSNNTVSIKSLSKQLKSVTAYDVLGRVLFENTNIQNKEFIIPNLKPSNNVLLLNIVDENNNKVQKKMIF